MSRSVLAALILLTPTFALAQEGESKPVVTQQDPEAAYKDLAKGLNKAIAEWRTEAMKQVKEAQEAGNPIPAIAMNPPTKEFIARALELADEYAGKDEAVRFLAFVIKNANTEGNAVKKAVRTLAADHAEGAAITDVIGFLPAAVRHTGPGAVSDLLDTVIEKNADANAKAKALITRGSMRLERAETDEDRAAARADLEMVAKVTEDEDLTAAAKASLFELDHLQVGCDAPDIAAKDTDGVDFKLSDYRGKVVLLDFWGFW